MNVIRVVYKTKKVEEFSLPQVGGGAAILGKDWLETDDEGLVLRRQYFDRDGNLCEVANADPCLVATAQLCEIATVEVDGVPYLQGDSAGNLAYCEDWQPPEYEPEDEF